MLIFLYILNSLLAIFFLVAGVNKVVRSKDSLRGMGMTWVDDMPAGVIKSVGLLEVAGAFGLVLPVLLDVAPILTPLAAFGLALVMAGAVVIHMRRRESFAMQAVLTALSLLSSIIGYLVVVA